MEAFFSCLIVLSCFGIVSTSNCSSKYCVEDKNRLISTRYSNVSACKDFKMHAMGQFLSQSVPEGVVHEGFQDDVIKMFVEKQKMALERPTETNDLKTFKIMNSFYKKCTETGW